MITLKRILYSLLALGALVAVLSNLYVWYKEKKEYQRTASIQEARRQQQAQKQEEPPKRELLSHPVEPHKTIHYFPEYLKLFKKALKQKNWALLHSLSDADHQPETRYGKPGEIHEDLEGDQSLIEGALKTLKLDLCDQDGYGTQFAKLQPNEEGHAWCIDKKNYFCTSFEHDEQGWFYQSSDSDCHIHDEESEITIMGQPLQSDDQ